MAEENPKCVSMGDDPDDVVVLTAPESAICDLAGEEMADIEKMDNATLMILQKWKQ